MNSCLKYFSACLLGIAALLVGASAAWAQTAPSLGIASSFGALGGAGVTCTSPIPALPAITVTGDVGSLLAAPSSVTGFPPTGILCTLSGSVELGATAAHADFLTAYNTIDTANPCPADAAHNLSGDLGGMTLSPGVYCISGVGLLTGTLTLAGPANGIWIFKATTSITPIGTAALRSKVVMANGGQACNVYWRTGTAATFVNTDFVGNLLAGSNITFDGSTLAGRALANTESVTMTGSSIIACDGGDTQPPSCDKHHKHHKHAKHHKHDKHDKHAKHHKHHKHDKQCDGDRGDDDDDDDRGDDDDDDDRGDDDDDDDDK
jgi:hypothetical protein